VKSKRAGFGHKGKRRNKISQGGLTKSDHINDVGRGRVVTKVGAKGESRGSKQRGAGWWGGGRGAIVGKSRANGITKSGGEARLPGNFKGGASAKHGEYAQRNGDPR